IRRGPRRFAVTGTPASVDVSPSPGESYTLYYLPPSVSWRGDLVSVENDFSGIDDTRLRAIHAAPPSAFLTARSSISTAVSREPRCSRVRR
ncbi:MAG: hypothetical protein HC923_12155, partial [Myxococcales bacterium]|nr:hypothetical protein [Myxococcales bacterium]